MNVSTEVRLSISLGKDKQFVPNATFPSLGEVFLLLLC
jgi:hypothetical protein